MLDILKNSIKKKILKPIKAFFVTNIITILLGLITIAIIIGGVSSIFSTFSNWLGGASPENETQEIMTWANSLTDEQVQEILDSGSTINPKLIPKYVEVEEKGIPENEIVKMDVVEVTWANGVTTTREWTKNHELMLYNKAYPYRLQWKFVAGLDVIDPKSSVWEFWLTDIIDQADNLLQPIYHWAYDRYSRDITYGTQYWVEETHDGVTTKQKYKEVNRTEYIPLEFLEKVEGTIADYSFEYKEDVETVNTGWQLSGDKNTIRWTTGGEPIRDKKGNITGYTRVIHHSRTTWTETKTVVIEDLFLDVSKNPRIDRVANLFDENKITLDDLGMLTAIISQMPNTQDLVEDLKDILIIANLEIDGEESGGNYGGGGISYDFNPNIPVIQGEWTREDLIDTAMSLLDLHYFWGGKYPRKGVNPNWGKLTKVTAAGVSYTGSSIPLGLDCSGFVDWVYVQMTGQTIGKGGGTVSQYANTYKISENELKPGDLGFYRYGSGGGKHVGIYIGTHNGKKLFIHSGGGQWSDSTHRYGRVVISYNNTSEYYKGNAPTKFVLFTRPYVEFAGGS